MRNDAKREQARRWRDGRARFQRHIIAKRARLHGVNVDDNQATLRRGWGFLSVVGALGRILRPTRHQQRTHAAQRGQ